MLTRSSIHRLSQEDPDNCGFITKQLGRAGSFCWVRASLCISTSFLLTTTTSTGPGGVAASVLRSQEGKGGLRLAGSRLPWTHFSLVSSPSVWHSPRPSAVLGTQGSRACTDLQSQTRTSSDPCLTFKWGFICTSVIRTQSRTPGAVLYSCLFLQLLSQKPGVSTFISSPPISTGIFLLFHSEYFGIHPIFSTKFKFCNSQSPLSKDQRSYVLPLSP